MNNELDLSLERVVDVSPELLFKAWTTPKHLMPWFCPKPYRTIECEIDLKPGGIFFTQMVDPNGNKLPAAAGCYLEVKPHSKLVWTSALGPGYRPLDPVSSPGFFTAVLTFEPHGDGGCRGLRHAQWRVPQLTSLARVALMRSQQFKQRTPRPLVANLPPPMRPTASARRRSLTGCTSAR